MEFLNSQEKFQLQQILTRSSLLKTADDRSNFLIFCGLEDYCSSIQLDKPLDKFIISLLVTLSKIYITDKNSEKQGLINFLEYIIQIDFSLSTEDKSFIDNIINRWKKWQEEKTTKIQHGQENDRAWLANVQRDSQILENLPQRKTQLFIGRVLEKQRIKESLELGVPRIRITGIGGIGKTTLALEIAHSLWETSRFNAVVWLSFETERLMNLSSFLDLVADTLSYGEIKKLSFQEKPVAVSRILRNFKSLLVIDAFEKANENEFCSFITSVPNSCQIISTSRCMSKLLEEEVIDIKPLKATESLKFIQIKSFNKRLAKASKETLEKISEVTSGLPLALEWAVGQINTGRQTIEHIIKSLNGAYAEEVYIRLFSDSYNQLSRDEKKLLLCLSFFENESSLLALEFISEYSSKQLVENLRKLIEASLVYVNDEFEEAKVRYSLHPLLRKFAQKKGIELQSVDFTILQRSFIEYYKNYITQRQFQDKGHPQGSYQEFEIELQNINAALDKCYEDRDGNTLLSFVTGLSYFYSTFGYWSERVRRGYQGIEACQWLEDYKNEAWMLINEVGYVLIQQEQYDEAEGLINSGIDILEKQIHELVCSTQLQEDAANPLGLQFMLGIGFRYLAIIQAKRGEYVQASQMFEKAFQIFIQLDRNTILANVRVELGELAIRQNEYEQAKKYFSESLEYHQAQKDKKHWVNSWIARAYNGLGDIAFTQSEWALAKDWYEKALESSLLIGSKEGLAYSKYRLALIAEQVGDKNEALQLAIESLELYNRIGNETQIKILDKMTKHLQI